MRSQSSPYRPPNQPTGAGGPTQVDLAGSERASRTGAEGSTLMLGEVQHVARKPPAYGFCLEIPKKLVVQGI